MKSTPFPISKAANRRLVRVSAASALLIAAGLGGCVPDLGTRPERAPVESFVSTASFVAPIGQWPGDQWWTSYGDAQLDALMAEGLQDSPDLKIAEARVRQAEAEAQMAGASLLPAISADASVLPTKQSLNTGFPDAFKDFLPRGWHNEGRATVNLDYQLDFFGKNAATLAAATSEADAARVEGQAARIQISTALAAAYANLARLAADRTAAVDALKLRQQSAQLVADRVRNALENKGQLAEAQSDVAAAEADLDSIDGQIAHSRNQLAALLGKGPDRGLAIALPARPKLHAFGVPARLALDLVGRRADIVAARLQTEAAASRIDAAHADFYPNIDLSGFLGLQSLDLKTLLQKDSQIGQLGPALHLPIFDGGRIEGNYRGSRAAYDEAVAQYDKTLIGALQDVADALADQRASARELGHTREALASLKDAYAIAQTRYAAGLSRYLDVLSAGDKLVAQQRRVADLEALAFAQDVALIRALGGGFVVQPSS